MADVPPGPLRDRLLRSINLLDNASRGLIAEVLVAEVVGARLASEAWAPWDVTMPAGIRIEVKSTGLVQS